jgi:superfamily II DNA/RNA helicase
VQSVLALLGEKAVHYYGKTDDRQRTVNKQRFIQDSSVQYMVSTAAAGGVGIDGYQKVCNSNIYYSNSFNAIHRWQSEDRTNRTGLVFESTLYIDLICRSGIDRKLLSNLRGKRDLSSLMLDEIRSFVKDEN